MNNLNLKMNFGTVMSLIFFTCILMSIILKDTIFDLIISDPTELTESQQASQAIANSILELEKVQLDTNILKADYFNNINVLPTFPTDSKTLSNFGKANPFLGGFVVTPTQATTTVGGVIFSSQRSINDGRSVTPVNSATNRSTINNR